MEILGIVPARSGSTGVKHKNVRDLAGQPLMSYTIEAAKRSGLSRVILSTDSDEYSEIGRRYGAEVPFLRPAEFASVDAKAISVIRHAIEFFDQEENWRPDAVMYLQPTSPFRRSERIDEAIKVMNSNPNTDSVISVREITEHPYYMFEPHSDELLKPYVEMENRPERRQDLPDFYTLNDNILMSRTDYLMHPENENGLIINLNNFVPVYITESEFIDINSERDFLWAEFLMGQQAR
ncbi:MAG: acylneuraminate cytidylyltransferase family protein [Gammaproteobacteria bacterium]|nr:acylneuraminate cytidylyltransferase family protein [Gammaproteobacteria bacterium]